MRARSSRTCVRSVQSGPQPAQSGPQPNGLTTMFEDNEILTQIKLLGDELRTRLDDVDRRLRNIEEQLPAGSQEPAATVHNHLAATNGHSEFAPAAPQRTVSVTIRPLHDVSRVRVVETAFLAIDGVESVALQTLSGDSAQLEVRAGEDVALISGLRRTLGLAFDINESDNSSFTIALAQPGAGREGGVAAHEAR